MMRGVSFAILMMAFPAFAADTPDMRGTPFAMQGGEAVYRGVCQGCHMADAKGASGAGTYPALAANPKLAEAGYVLSMVMNGHRGMPPFRGHFTNAQVADVINYVRSHFGNHYKGKVTEADVQAQR
jgi:mono/diheme cytochrome c family protein